MRGTLKKTRMIQDYKIVYPSTVKTLGWCLLRTSTSRVLVFLLSRLPIVSLSCLDMVKGLLGDPSFLSRSSR